MPVDVSDQYIRIRVKSPGLFEDDSFRTITLSEDEGIRAIVGRLAGESKTTIQAYLFAREKWDEERAKQWVEEHQAGETKAAVLDYLLLSAYEAAGVLPTQVEKGATGHAVKALEEDAHGAIVGGHLVLWGDPQHRDLQAQYFTKTTELWLDRYPVVPALFHHGLDPAVDLSVVGHRLKAEVDEQGVWVKHWLDKSSRFWTWIEPLLAADKLFYSPGSASHLVRIDAKTGEIKSFPIVEDTLTPVPAQPRLKDRPVERIKAAYHSANLAAPDLDGGESADSRREQARADALRLAIELERQRLHLDTA